MTYYSILDLTPTTDEWVADYVAETGEIVAKHGGKYLSRTTVHEQIEGNEQNAALRIILEWPTKESALAFMSDPDYSHHLKARTEGSVSNHYLVKGNDDLK